MGKSTILNLAMTPWREPPQLPRRVYDEFGETGLRELIWSHGGETYRTRIEYRQTGKTPTQRAYLHVLRKNPAHVSQNAGDGHDWQPVTLPDHTVSDGKSSNYDACLAHILGDQGLYYLSAFRAQGCAKLADHTDPKALMRALLDLDKIDMLAGQSAIVVRELKRSYETDRAQAAALDGHPARIAELESAVLEICAGHTALVETKLFAIDAAALAKAELERALSGDLDRQRLIDQRAVVQARITEARGAGEGAVNAAKRDLKAAEGRVTAALSAAMLAEQSAKNDIQSARSRAVAAAAVLTQRDAIAKAEQDAADLAAQIDTQVQTADGLSDRLRDLRELAGQIRTLDAQQGAAAQAGRACAAKVSDIEARIADLNVRAGFVAVVPCRGEGEYAACPALQDAIAARGMAEQTLGLLPAAQGETEAKRSEWKAIAAQIAAIAPQVQSLPECAEAHAQAMTVIGTLRTRLDAVRAIAAKGSALALAEQNHAEAMTAVDSLTDRMTVASDTYAAQIATLEGEVETARLAVSSAEAAAAAAVAALNAELAAIPDPGTDQAVTMARENLAAAEAAVDAAKSAMETATATKAAHRADIARLQAELAACADIIARSTELAQQIADWTLLQRGLLGVIDLSIEDSGPGIATLANQLLREAYGPRFSVRIVTQREQANGKTVEDFDISVLDNETEEWSSILHKSGGESVWLDKAMTDAVGLYHQDAAGMSYETLFADEAEDGLTQERKAQFYQMDRSALQMGRYKRKYFVSHNPEAWEMADYVIDLAQYRVQ